MKIEHPFEYNADIYEISGKFCANDSEYQANVLNAIGLSFKLWTNANEILEISEKLNEDGKWFIETLRECLTGSEDNE